MTSMVLARKHRPLNFDAMVGQGHVVQALTNALLQQRLHHAYLFTGTRGVGKTTVSRILAKSLNCTGPSGDGGITAHPCGQCQPCRDIDAGRFVDYVEMDAASNRGVDEISQLLDQAVYKPVVGRFKVYMIDEVHMLTNTAFNAMLKTLEEPPDYLKFVLATTDPQKVPVTVLSRCLQFNLRPMPQQTVREHLETVLTAEGVPFDRPALSLLARAARGSMRDGLSLTDQAIAFGAGQVLEHQVLQMLGSVDRQHVVRILQAVLARDGAGLLAAVDQLRLLGLSASGTLDDLAAALQDVAVLQAVPELAETDPERAVWAEVAQALPADECQLFYNLALHGRAELGLSPDEYAGLLMILLRWLAFRPAASGAGDPPRPKASRPAAEQPSGQPDPAASTRVAEPEPGSAPMPSRSVPPESRPLPEVQPAPAPPSRLQPQPTARSQPPASTSPQAPMDERPEPPPWEDGPPESLEPEAPSEPAARVPSRAQAVVRPQRAQADPVPAAAEGVPGFTPVPEVPETPLGTRWADVVARLQAEGLIVALVRELAMQAECVGVEESAGHSVWRLRVERETLRSESQRDRLNQALRQVLGEGVVLEVEAGVARDTPALREQSDRAARQRAAEVLIHQDVLVKRLLDAHPGARIVHGSISPLSPASSSSSSSSSSS